MFKKAQTFFLFWIVSCCICQPLLGVPAEVIIIRHGEKPRNKELLYLDKKGEVRAAALAPYFMET